jgi:protein-tyrosine phosphatase
MIDIHCHILPGVDDGAKDMEMSLTMARAAYADGIRTMIATPHYNKSWRVDRDTVLRKVAELSSELARQGIPITVLPGNELRLESVEFVSDAMDSGQFCYLADDSKFVLLEQAWEGYNPGTPALIERFTERGVRVILAHPERHLFFRAKPELLDPLLARGAWTQINASSLIGETGPDAQAFAFHLVDRGLAHTLATDAHNLTRRPILSLGFQAVANRAGEAEAEAIRDRMRAIVPES